MTVSKISYFIFQCSQHRFKRNASIKNDDIDLSKLAATKVSFITNWNSIRTLFSFIYTILYVNSHYYMPYIWKCSDLWNQIMNFKQLSARNYTRPNEMKLSAKSLNPYKNKRSMSKANLKKSFKDKNYFSRK